MSKKMITATAVLIAVFATAVPVYAQSTTPSSNTGLLGGIESFFGNFFHRQKNVDTGGQAGVPGDNITPGENAPSGTMNMPAKGGSDYFTMQENRVKRLIQQGLITQAQGDAIIAEQQKVQTELKDWAAAEGINEAYVMGGPSTGMGEGQIRSGFQKGVGPTGTQQFQGRGKLDGQGYGFQKGGQGGSGGTQQSGASGPDGGFNRQGE